MTDEDAFLEEIAISPDDDVIRLVFADWLDDHGKPERADALRYGVKKAKPFTFGPGRPAQLSYTTTRPDLPNIVNVTLAVGIEGVAWTTYKGTISSATCTWATWLDLADAVIARGRPPEVILTTRPNVAIDRIGPDLLDCVRVPGRINYHLPRGVSPALTYLTGEWPAVKRWTLPERVEIPLRLRGATGPEFAAPGVYPPSPKVGELVKLRDGSVGLMMGPADAEGFAPVRMLP